MGAEVEPHPSDPKPCGSLHLPRLLQGLWSLGDLRSRIIEGLGPLSYSVGHWLLPVPDSEMSEASLPLPVKRRHGHGFLSGDWVTLPATFLQLPRSGRDCTSRPCFTEDVRHPVWPVTLAALTCCPPCPPGTTRARPQTAKQSPRKGPAGAAWARSRFRRARPYANLTFPVFQHSGPETGVQRENIY